ncbi:histone-like nucleoid-structuring protein, MvaT/MvaU family [Marinobacter salarius]|uniref:histone-like nucleoid-structuring protein, MvaT/MvaU family n=1 Tax=Marinobacter salarius TaxID=1420917 RepID=UPI003BABAE66
MSVITTYHNKLVEMDRLKAEIDRLKNSEELKDALAFQADLEKLMDKYSKSAKDVAAIVGGEVATTKTGRSKRTPSTWTNPHTGEKVVTAGGNHKTLKEWREEYGAEEVAKWKE